MIHHVPLYVKGHVEEMPVVSHSAFLPVHSPVISLRAAVLSLKPVYTRTHTDRKGTAVMPARVL